MSESKLGDVLLSPDGNEIAWYRPIGSGDERPWLVIEVDEDYGDTECTWVSPSDVEGWKPLKEATR